MKIYPLLNDAKMDLKILIIYNCNFIIILEKIKLI